MDHAGRRHLCRQLRADVLPAAIAGVVVLFGSNRAAHDHSASAQQLDTTAYILLSLSVVAILLRRHAPLTMLGIESLIVGTFLVLGYPQGPSVLALCIAAYAVGARYPPGHASLFIGKAAVLFAVASLVGGDGLLDDAEGFLAEGLNVIVMLALVVVPGLIGHLVRQSRIYAARASDEATRRKLEEERLRVAREVHDVVGHSLSIISLQAGVALHVLDRRPEQAQLALEAIRRTSIDALEELRATLALTRAGRSNTDSSRADGAGVGAGKPGERHRNRDPQSTSLDRATLSSSAADSAGQKASGNVGGGNAGSGNVGGGWGAGCRIRSKLASAGAGRVPLTGLARLAGLVAEVRLCDVPIELTVTGTARPLPPDIDLAAYRVIQESITNVLRHAGAAQVHIRLEYQQFQLAVEVVDRPVTGIDPAGTQLSAPRARQTGTAPGATSPANPGPLALAGAGPAAASSGHGLVGLSARVTELAGTFTAGALPTGGWRVRAELPAPAAPPIDTPPIDTAPIDTARIEVPIDTARIEVPIDTAPAGSPPVDEAPVGLAAPRQAGPQDAGNRPVRSGTAKT